jgi:hypothetical protein
MTSSVIDSTAAVQRVCQQVERAYANDISNPAAIASDAVTALQELEAIFPDQKAAFDSLIARAQSSPGLGSVVFITVRSDFCVKNGLSGP